MRHSQGYDKISFATQRTTNSHRQKTHTPPQGPAQKKRDLSFAHYRAPRWLANLRSHWIYRHRLPANDKGLTAEVQEKLLCDLFRNRSSEHRQKQNRHHKSWDSQFIGEATPLDIPGQHDSQNN